MHLDHPRPTIRHRRTVFALALAACAAALLHTVDVRPEAGWVVLIIVPWGLAASSVEGIRDWRPLIVAAVVARLVQVGAPPWLSDDLYRYLFEGMALNQGHNPFLTAPADLAALDPELAAKVNHADVPSIYPPVAQLWFRLLALFGTSALVAQTMTATIDIANVAMIRKLTPETSWPAWVYALHPVAVLESAHGAHLEPIAVAACLLTVYCLETRPSIAGVFAVLGAGVKLLPILFVPAVWRRAGPRDALLSLGGGVLVVGLLAIPVVAAGPELLTAMRLYSSHWSFNGLVFPLVDSVAPDHGRLLLGLAGLAVAGWAATLPARRAWLVVGTGFLMLSPTVHPWYTLWALVPALLLQRRGWAYAAVSLQASYLVLLTVDVDTGDWAPQAWLGPLTWGGALFALYRFREPKPTRP